MRTIHAYVVEYFEETFKFDNEIGTFPARMLYKAQYLK